MIGVAIVDDDRYMLENARQILRDIVHGYEGVRIDIFQSASEFLDAMKLYRYQILITDIDMPEINGIELCKRARKICPEIYIIFLTAYVEYAIDSYRMDAYQYILKSEIEDRFPETAGRLVEMVSKSQRNFSYIGIGLQKERVQHCDIICIRKMKKSKYVEFITYERILYERNSIEKTLEKLNSDEFVSVERGCAVNLRHVTKIEDTIINLSNGMIVEASTVRVKEIKESLNRYWREN